MYTEVGAHAQKEVAEGEWFSATTDLWTSSGGSGEPYISFKVHFPSRLGTEIVVPQNCFFPPVDHTAANITEFFENMLQEWNIKKESLSSITADNATNMKTLAWLTIAKVLTIQRVDSSV